MILVTASEMQEMDRRTIETGGIPGIELMENAGRGAFRFLLDYFPEATQSNSETETSDMLRKLKTLR